MIVRIPGLRPLLVSLPLLLGACAVAPHAPAPPLAPACSRIETVAGDVLAWLLRPEDDLIARLLADTKALASAGIGVRACTYRAVGVTTAVRDGSVDVSIRLEEPAIEGLFRGESSFRLLAKRIRARFRLGDVDPAPEAFPPFEATDLRVETALTPVGDWLAARLIEHALSRELPRRLGGWLETTLDRMHLPAPEIAAHWKATWAEAWAETWAAPMPEAPQPGIAPATPFAPEVLVLRARRQLEVEASVHGLAWTIPLPDAEATIRAAPLEVSMPLGPGSPRWVDEHGAWEITVSPKGALDRRAARALLRRLRPWLQRRTRATFLEALVRTVRAYPTAPP